MTTTTLTWGIIFYTDGTIFVNVLGGSSERGSWFDRGDPDGDDQMDVQFEYTSEDIDYVFIVELSGVTLALDTATGMRGTVNDPGGVELAVEGTRIAP